MREMNLLETPSQRAAEQRIQLLDKAKNSEKNYKDFEQYGYDYFDNSDFGIGYGGYSYDGRYAPTAKKLCEEFQLKPGDRVLEIGCAKGYFLVEFHYLGLDVTGIDASRYAIDNAKEEVKEKIVFNQSPELPFPDNNFDFVLAKEVIPHLEENDAMKLIQEAVRVTKGDNLFFEIQCANDDLGAKRMKAWDPTHKTIETRDWWINRLEELHYKGSFYCKALF